MNDVANADLKIVHVFYISPVIVQGTDGKLFYWFFSSLKADILALEILTVLAEGGYQLPIYPDPISSEFSSKEPILILYEDEYSSPFNKK